MKRNFSTVVLTPDGKPYQDNGTLRDVAFTALGATLPDDRLTGADKVKMYLLASKIAKSKAGIVDVTAEEIVLLKDRIGRAMSPFIVGRCFELLDDDGGSVTTYGGGGGGPQEPG